MRANADLSVKKSLLLFMPTEIDKIEFGLDFRKPTANVLGHFNEVGRQKWPSLHFGDLATSPKLSNVMIE